VTNETVNAVLGVTVKALDESFGRKKVWFDKESLERQCTLASELPRMFVLFSAEAFLRKNDRKGQS
jgi:hypothetical protein